MKVLNMNHCPKCGAKNHQMVNFDDVTIGYPTNKTCDDCKTASKQKFTCVTCGKDFKPTCINGVWYGINGMHIQAS